MKRRWGQQSCLAPLATGMDNLSMESSERNVQTANEVDMIMKLPSGAEVVTQRVGKSEVQVPEPQAVIDSKLSSGQAAMHVGWDTHEASPIKGQAIESDSEIDHVGLAGRKHTFRAAKARAEASNEALAEDPKFVGSEQAERLVHTERYQAGTASPQVPHSERMLAYSRDDNRSEIDEEEEPVSSRGVYVNRAIKLQRTACTTPQMKRVAMAGISRCAWLNQGSMMHAARAATADASAVNWNCNKTRAARPSLLASSSTKVGPVLRDPSYAAKQQRPKEGIWRIDLESPIHRSQPDMLGSHARQPLPSIEGLLTAVPRLDVQPLASGDRIQYDAPYEKFDEMMHQGFVLENFERAALAAEVANEAEAETIENEDDDALRALYSQSSNGNDEAEEEASVMDAAYGSDEVDALEDDVDAMEEMSSVVSRDMSDHVAATWCTSSLAMLAKHQRKNKFESVIQHLLTRNSDERPGTQASTHVLPLWLDIRKAAVGPAKKGALGAHSDAVLVEFTDLHLQVLREDIWTLDGVGLPNPTVVYAYMVLLQERNNVMQDQKLGHPRCHFLGPDLLKSILAGNLDDVWEWQEPLQLQDMGGRRSTGILDCDKLICVVPLEDSWVCVGIDLEHQVIKWYDSLLQEDDDDIVGALVNWVQHESKQTLDLSRWEVKNPMDMALPAETNSYDSGVFALLFAEYASRDAVIDFTSEHIGASRVKMISDIMLKRIHIPHTA